MLSRSSPRIVIMGAWQGVGRACAERLADRGAELILSDHDGERLRALSVELSATGLFCDVLSEASVKIFATELVRQFDRIDVLINAAGCGFERTLGMHRVSRALLPSLRKNPDPSSILNIPAPRGKLRPTMFEYASSKRAFESLCESLAVEANGSAVEVQLVSPEAIGLGSTRQDDDVENALIADHIAAMLLPPPAWQSAIPLRRA